MPDEYSAVMWLTVRDNTGQKVAAAGTATIKVFEAQDRRGHILEVGPALYTFVRDVSSDDYLLPDAACQPCAMADSNLVVTLGVIPFDRLERVPVRSLGLVKVTFKPARGAALVDRVPFGYPDQAIR